MSKLERLLVAVDDSANGQFGSRVAGMIAGTRSMPTTVMHITAEKKSATKKSDNETAGPKKAEAKKEKEKEAKEKEQDKEDAKSAKDKQADKEAAEDAKERAEAAAALLKIGGRADEEAQAEGAEGRQEARHHRHSRSDHGDGAARRRGREGLRPAGDRTGQDDDPRQQRIPSQHHAARGRLRRPAHHRRCARRAPE